jgi:serine protease DegQ
MGQIVATGRVRYARLGVLVADLVGDGRGLEGVKVERVEPGSGAERAGLRVGDIITAVDGRTVRSASDLRSRIALSPVESAVKVDVVRDSRTMTLQVRLSGT